MLRQTVRHPILRPIFATIAGLVLLVGLGQAAKEIKPGWNLFKPAQDIQLGREASQEIEQQVEIVNDERLTNYVARIGKRLADVAPGEKYPYSFKVVAEPSINAFALPGGPMYVHSGLISATDNEAQLAGVLAHEVSHVALRHSTNQASKAYAFQIPIVLATGMLGNKGENDNEGLILTIAKDGSTHGRLQAMETLAHNNIYSYQNDRQVKKGVHNFDGKVELRDGSHPVIFIESGGHGVYGSKDHHSRYSLSRDEFSAGTGVTYSYKGKAERPKHPNDRNVGYQLLPIYEHWWLRAHEGSGDGGRAFDAYYACQPYGGRPRPREARIAGSFLGRKHGSNKAKPFWGWHDNRTRKRKVVATGQWGLDPAYSVSRNLRFPGRFSRQYIYNPYLGIGSPRALDPVSTPLSAASPPRVRSSVPERVAGGQSGWNGTGADIEAFRVPRSKDYNSSSKRGQFDIRMHVDGEVDFFVQADTIRYRVLSGRPPEDDSSEHSQPIPRATFRRFELEKKDGRGRITLVGPPSAANNFTARLRISDPKGSDDRYHARLRWEAGETVAAPPRNEPVSTPAASPPAPSTALPTLPEDPRSNQSEPTSATAPRRSRVLSKHMEAVLRGPRTATPTPAEASQPEAPAKIDLPGVEIFSDDNDPNRYDDADNGLFEFRGRVDGTVRIRIRGDRVLAESTGGRPLEVERFSFTQPLPSSRVGDMSVERQGWPRPGRSAGEALGRQSLHGRRGDHRPQGRRRSLSFSADVEEVGTRSAFWTCDKADTTRQSVKTKVSPKA